MKSWATWRKKLGQTKKYSQAEEIESMQKWQWNDAVAREMLMEVDNAANQCFQKYDFAKAEENNNDALLLLKQILQNINSFDPYLQNDEKRIRNNLQLAQTNRVKQQNQFTVNNKQQEEALMTKLREEIDTCSKIKLPSFNIMDTFFKQIIPLFIGSK